jgi:pimeloyl-ACP methyl ester carboxylesterase
LEPLATSKQFRERGSFAPELLGYGEHRDAAFETISLPAQLEHLARKLAEQVGDAPVDLVGHSVGGVLALLLAEAHPSRVRRVVSVEGNFTLRDAFWSASIGRMSPEQADAMLEGFRADPAGWLESSGLRATAAQRDTAAQWLAHQPASTLRAMGQSVVDTTGPVAYLAAVQRVFSTHPVYLLAGERSRAGWDVPEWATRSCAGSAVLEGCGHLMMLEQPEAFAQALARCLEPSE